MQEAPDFFASGVQLGRRYSDHIDPPAMDDIPFEPEGSKSVSPGPSEKRKLTRNARACLACRKVKTKCKNDGTAPCQRCIDNSLDCVFEKSHRGGRQPGAKNLSTLRAQGLLPAVRDKNIPANKAAKMHAAAQRVRQNSEQSPASGGTLHSVTIEESPVLSFPTISDGPNSLSATWITHPSLATPIPAPSSSTGTDQRQAHMDPLLALVSDSSTKMGTPASQHEPPLSGVPGSSAERSYHDADNLLRLMQPKSSFSADRTTLNGDVEMSAPSRHALHPTRKQRLAPDSVVQQAAIRSHDVSQQEMFAESPSSGSHASSTAGAPVSGVADPSYWKAGPLSDLTSRRRLILERQPEIMKLIQKEDVTQLFDLYFRHLHQRFAILSPAFHKPERVAQRSPFLLTVICAVAAHFSETHSRVSQQLAELAKRLCFEVPSRGSKTVEIIQGFLLLTAWTIASPPQRHEEDKSYLILGLAKSMMGDLGLHRLEPARGLTGDRAVEMENKIRTYLFCYLKDHELSTQLGRVPTVREIPCVRNPDLYLPSPLSIEDLAATMMVEYYRIISRTLEVFQVGMEYAEHSLDQYQYRLATGQFEDQINGWMERYSHLFKDAIAEPHTSPESTQVLQVYALYCKFCYHLATLSLNSFGLADSLERQSIDVPYFFTKCYSSATASLSTAKDTLADFGFACKYLPDNFYVSVSYAAVSLLRFCRPRFSKMHKFTNDIADLIGAVADELVRNSVSPAHISNSYGLFLRTLVQAQKAAPFATSVAATPRPGSPINEDASKTEEKTGLFGDDFVNGTTTRFFDDFETPTGFGLDQLVPSQWSALDKRFDTVYSLAASETWDSVLPPGFNLPGGFDKSQFLTMNDL